MLSNESADLLDCLPMLVGGFKIYDKMSLLVPFTFKDTALFKGKVDSRPWTCAKTMGRVLGYEKAARQVIRHHSCSDMFGIKINW